MEPLPGVGQADNSIFQIVWGNTQRIVGTIKTDLGLVKKSAKPGDVDFPFPRVPLNDEDIFNKDTHYIKFQTPHYVAYVFDLYLPYITADHLFQEKESFAFWEARRATWGMCTGKEGYHIQTTYSREYARINSEYWDIDTQYMKDNAHLYDKELLDKHNEINDRYTAKRFIWELIKDNSEQILEVSKTSVTALAVAGVVFFCFYPSYRH